jgi:hypothetical protein
VAGWLALLLVTNLLTLVALVVLWRRNRADVAVEQADDVFTAPRPAGAGTRSRHLITIEVLNPIELVGTRGRVAGLAGSLAPGLARRVVYDQVLKTLRRELAGKQVVADVRLHQLRPAVRADQPPEIDEVTSLELGDLAVDVESDQL